MPRIEPLSPPYEPDVADALAAMMPPGVPLIGLFRTFAVNLPMAEAMQRWGGYELSSKLSLSMRDRELVIDRVCARCSCEYEWGVHVAFFAERVDFTSAQVTSLTHGSPTDDCWDEREAAILAAVDELHDRADLGDAAWTALRIHLDEAEVLDLLLLAGWYHAISYAANAAQVELEPGAPRFADVR
ncbi:MAG: carboxymuconolactone decarboxylase family protein [Actinomycetota bacterium]